MAWKFVSWMGLSSCIRPIRPDDKQALAKALSRLSDESVRMRFLVPKPRFTGSELKYLTEVDFVDHYAIVAAPRDRPDVILGVGRWVRDARAAGTRPRWRSSSPTTSRARASGAGSGT